LVWAMFPLFCWEIRSPIAYPQGIGLIPRPLWRRCRAGAAKPEQLFP
jgi:hypothetical protein